MIFPGGYSQEKGLRSLERKGYSTVGVEEKEVKNLDIYHGIYHILPIKLFQPTDDAMETAKIFQNGRSQAVRLPKEFRFKGKEVFIHRERSNVILSEKPDSWESFFLSGKKPTPDFMQDREQLDLEDRDIFK